MIMEKRLYRSELNKVVGGVCGGLGDYLGIDPVFIRVFFILWTVLGELGVLAYLILWVVMPTQVAAEAGETLSGDNIGGRVRSMGNEIGDIARQPSAELITFAGIGLIAWGVYHLLRRVGFTWFVWDYSVYLWPALLIIAGAVVLLRTLRRK
jgi:phage shock protein PspC (stress-responsive transcriptional regulator)